MTGTSLAPRPRASRWLLAGWMATAAFVGFRFVPAANASHTHTGWDQKHIATIHGNDGPAGGGSGPGSLDEEYCIMSETSAMPASTIAPFIQETLAALSFDTIWDGSADWRVDLWRTQKYCNEYSTADRNRIEIEYRVRETWASVCGGDIYACVTSVSPVTDSSGAHQHYKYMNVHLKREQMAALGSTTRARKFINHETGHVLGLRDPEYYGHCMHSVMHNNLYSSLGCTDPVWHPTPSDFASVRSIANRTN
ncbi:hypothetical protein [Pyxidicoccus trucidator]|uniref:hypothetical protein n=1 Tax=Pyxidicoccus trucidator TaxID=2709662 RepID=UPI001F077B82|nr:hypothetical protein [Pyxidicoccus trucidator]